MALALTEDVLQDDLAISVARVLAAANKRTHAEGVDALHCSVSIDQQNSKQGTIWRVSYLPQNGVNSRGGDLMIDIDALDFSVQRVLRGQ